MSKLQRHGHLTGRSEATTPCPQEDEMYVVAYTIEIPRLCRICKPTSISPTDEIHRKSLLKRDGIKKKNEYQLDRGRMRANLAQGDRFSPLILMKGCFMRIDRHRKFSPGLVSQGLIYSELKLIETRILWGITTQIKYNIFGKIRGKI
ncbi:MAG: hypothetical protein QNJ72_07795 [Pleurocapsa sp. MO_226.B13]|nr:hypothetical protein [Pleurocapsa sp. MO_226.B13]